MMSRRSRIAIVLAAIVLVSGGSVFLIVSRTDDQTAARTAMEDATTTPRPLISQMNEAQWRKDANGSFISSRQALDIALNRNPGSSSGHVRYVADDPAGSATRTREAYVVTVNTGKHVLVDAHTGHILE